MDRHILKLPSNLNRTPDRHKYFLISFLTMDDKRIIVGENFKKDCRYTMFQKESANICVYDSFNLERECILEAPGAGRIQFMQLQGDLLFCSFYSNESIYVWDLSTEILVQKLQDDIPGLCVDRLFHAAHGLLITCYNVADGYQFSKEIDGYAHLIVRRIQSPTEMAIEKKEHLPLWEINQVESDANYFAVSLSFGVPESREIQIRSKFDFQIIHCIEMTPDYKCCSFHNGQLLTSSLIIEFKSNFGKLGNVLRDFISIF